MTRKLLSMMMAACLTLIALPSCSSDDDAPSEVSVTAADGSALTDMQLPVEGGSATVNVTASSQWSVTTDAPEWLTATSASGATGSTLTITAAPFDAYASATGSRVGFVTVACGSATARIAVMQYQQLVNPGDESLRATVRRIGGTKELEIPASVAYSIEIPAEAQGWITAEATSGLLTLDVAENESDEARSAVVRVMSSGGEREIATVAVEQSWRNVEPGEILFEEIFFTGSALPSTGKTNTRNVDQYFLLTNNTDETLYADRLLIIESKNANAGKTWKEFKQPIIEEFCEAGVVMCVPGNGTDVPLEPGESLLIASNGINYREGYSVGADNMKVEMNPNGIDLSKADFEWYVESSKNVIDIDIPEVPNVQIWFAYTQSILNLHDRGFQSYALATAPASMTKEKFLETYNWAGAEYVNHTLTGDFDQTLTAAYKVPNSWVIDAVMCTVPSINQVRQFSTTLDAGWTYCSPQNIDQDAQRYGLSVRRKRDAESNRLIDTNNSTNDFTPNATPSLR